MRSLCGFLLLTTSVFAGVDGMQTRVFPLKCELIGGLTFVRPQLNRFDSPLGFRQPRPPFVANEPLDEGGPVALRQTAKAVLMNEGIPFPPGASASYHPQSGLLSVHNTPENLRHTQLFLESMEHDLPLNLSYLVTVIEAPGEMIRLANAAAASNPDCSKELSALLAAAERADSGVSVVGDAFVESQSNRRTTFASVQEHLIPQGMTTKAKRAVTIDMDLVESGLKFEAESWRDEKDLKLVLEVNTLPPSQRTLTVSDPTQVQSGSFPTTSIWQSKLMTSLSCQPGQTRLISVSKPLGAKDQDVLWAVFLNVGVQRIPSIPVPAATLMETNESTATPSGLKKIAFDLPEGFLQFLLPNQAAEDLQPWLESNGLEKIKGASASQTQSKLVVTNTQENIERVHGILRDMRRSLPGTPVCTFNTIQAPAARLRDLTRAHVIHGDHAALWRALQEAVSKDEASYIDTAQITTDSDQRATHHTGRENSIITDFSTNENGQASVDFERRTTGSVIELGAWLPALDDYIGIQLSHELQTGPTTSTRHAFKHPSSGQPFELSLPDLHTAKTTHNFSITPGTTRLISLCRPAGAAKSDVLWATFISCDVMRQLPSRQPRPSATLAKAGDPLKLETRVFQPPAGYFSPFLAGWGPINADTAAHALKDSGIDLPSDAEIHVSNDSTILRVKSTRKCLDQIDAVFKQAGEFLQQNVVINAHVFEGPGDFIREAAHRMRRQTDHSGLLASLQTDTKIGKVKYVTTLRIETHSGVRAQAEQARQIQQLSGIRPSGNDGTEFLMEMHQSGLLFELEPKIHPDNNTVSLEFALDSSSTDPIERKERLIDTSGKQIDFPMLDFLGSKLTSTVTMSPGTTQLVWIYRPAEATDDRLHAVFFHFPRGAGSK